MPMPLSAEAGSSEGRRASVYLHPGHLHISPEPAAVTTILGSCVSVCVYDRAAGIGGINHYLLPFWSGNGTSSPRFGNVAMKALVERVLTLGGRRASIEAKVFGGACVLAAFRMPQGRHLGDHNVDCALEALAAEGIPVVARDTGGERARKLVFHTDTGAAWLREI